jgi:DNA-binding NarL/FixJ family response regulator
LTILSDGEKLMNKLLNTTDLPSFLFLDLNMPRKNGFQCLSEIRALPELNHLKVIVISTSNEFSVLQELRMDGAQYYIHKPSDFSILKKVISQALSKISEIHTDITDKEKFILSGDILQSHHERNAQN